jgi:hypothetical protein
MAQNCQNTTTQFVGNIVKSRLLNDVVLKRLWLIIKYYFIQIYVETGETINIHGITFNFIYRFTDFILYTDSRT